MLVPENSDDIEPNLEEVVAHLAGPHGMIADDLNARYRRDFSPGYPCIMQAGLLLQDRMLSKLQDVARCMEQTSRRFKPDPFFMERVTWLNETLKFHDNGVKQIPLAPLTTVPDSGSAYSAFLRARKGYFEGDCGRGDSWAGKAIERNPLDSYILGNAATHMMGCDNPAAAELAKKAIDLDRRSPPIVWAVRAYQMNAEGDSQAAFDLAEEKQNLLANDHPSLKLVQILAALDLSRRNQAMTLWRELALLLNLPENAGVERLLNKQIANPVLRRKIRDDFQRHNFKGSV